MKPKELVLRFGTSTRLLQGRSSRALPHAVLLGAVIIISCVSLVEAAITYEITDGQFSFQSGELWEIESGSMGIGLVNVSTRSDGLDEAVYRIESFDLLATDNSGTSHTILAVPDGIPGQYSDGRFPDEPFDIGVVGLLSNGAIDFLVYDLSINSMPVDPSDTIGGPSFVGSTWQGSFPIPSEFTVTGTADLFSQGLFGEVMVSATIPEPSCALFGFLSLFSLARRRR